jgi:hypothetical protein
MLLLLLLLLHTRACAKRQIGNAMFVLACESLYSTV